jgi:hypothetical protein
MFCKCFEKMFEFLVQTKFYAMEGYICPSCGHWKYKFSQKGGIFADNRFHRPTSKLRLCYGGRSHQPLVDTRDSEGSLESMEKRRA